MESNTDMEEYYERELTETVKSWIERKEVIAIKGPRQSGKTTLLRMLINWLKEERGVDEGHIIFKTMEDPDFREQFDKKPRDTVESYLADGEKHYFFLDEFHYLADGGEKLKFMYDTTENVKFIITGSSSLELTGSTSKHLVGRMFSTELYPFSFWEFLNVKEKRLARIYEKKNVRVMDFIRQGTELDVEEDPFVSDFQDFFKEFILYGSYPEVIKSDSVEMKKTVLKNLFDTYITRDIVALLRIQESSEMRRFVRILSSQLGGMIKYSNLSDSGDLYYKKTKEFLSVLEETYVIDLIKPYHKNLRTELRKNPKVYFVDPGLRNHALKNFLPVENRRDQGEMVENFVLSQLRCHGAEEVNYWRTRGQAEVDFIYRHGMETIPIEVKYKSFNSPRISRGYRSYISTYRPKRAVVVTKDFWGEDMIQDTEVKFIPVCYI